MRVYDTQEAERVGHPSVSRVSVWVLCFRHSVVLLFEGLIRGEDKEGGVSQFTNNSTGGYLLDWNPSTHPPYQKSGVDDGYRVLFRLLLRG